MTKTDIVAKIKKLLALSQSHEPEEAARAASMAQELMIKYAVEEHELEGTSAKGEPIEIEALDKGDSQKIPRWHAVLAQAMAKGFFCVSYFTPGVANYLVGRRTDREVFKATYFYVRDEVTRMCEVAWNRDGKDSGVHGKRWKSSFCNGAVDTIHARLTENLNKLLNPAPEGAENPEDVITVDIGRIARAAQTTAIVLASRLDDANKHLRDNVEGLRERGVKRRISRDAYEQGKDAGAVVDLSGRSTKSLPE